MLIYLAALLVYSLIVYGAVLPHAWLTISVLWILGFAVVMLPAVIKGESITRELASFAVGVLVMVFIGPKFAVAVFAGGWAWAGARKGPEAVLRFLNLLIVVGMIEALMGLVQFFVKPQFLFGYSTGKVLGTLINHNHFAGLLELIIPLSLGCALMTMRRHGDFARSYVYLLAGAFMGIALVFSISRSGIFSFVVTLSLMIGILGLRESRSGPAIALGLGLCGLILAGALWIGVDTVVNRYAVLLDAGSVQDDARLMTYRDTLEMIRDHPLGVGYGNYVDAFRQYQNFMPRLLFDHAHNDYLETTAEFGLPVASFLWGSIFVALYKMIRAFLVARSPERSGILFGCIGSVVAILVHSLMDFNLQIPSNAMLFASFLGIGIASCQPTKTQQIYS